MTWSMLRAITSDMHAAQQQMQRLCALSMSARRPPAPWSRQTWGQWGRAVFTQSCEIERCGAMLAVNFDASNDEPSPERAA